MYTQHPILTEKHRIVDIFADLLKSVIFQFFFFNKSAKMSTILCFYVNMGCCVYINEEKKMNLNDFSKWLQYHKE